MFDIGFPELLLVSIVALLVIGPERLPETIRTIMLWLGRIRRTFTNIKTELEQELGTDEIRRQLHNESIMKDIKETKETISDAFKEADQSIDEFKHSVHETISTVKDSATKHVTDSPKESVNGEVESTNPAEPVIPPQLHDNTNHK